MDLPALNTLVDVLLASGDSYPSRIEDVEGDLLRVAAPLDAVSDDPLELAWLRDDERLAAPVRLAAVTPEVWEVRVVGDVRRQTRRDFVRGGGGEPVRLARPDGAAGVTGWVMDIGEVSLRARLDARLETCDLRRTDPVKMDVDLGGDAVHVSGTVLDVRRMPETGRFDVVVAYEPTEALRRTIRGYVLRRQLEERRRER